MEKGRLFQSTAPGGTFARYAIVADPDKKNIMSDVHYNTRVTETIRSTS